MNHGGRLAAMDAVSAFVIVELDPFGDPGPGFWSGFPSVQVSDCLWLGVGAVSVVVNQA